jgi:hypothetical protein
MYTLVLPEPPAAAQPENKKDPEFLKNPDLSIIDQISVNAC